MGYWVLVVLGGAGLFSGGCGKPAPPPPEPVAQPAGPPVPAPPPPPTPTMRLEAISPVSLDPGARTAVTVQIQRSGVADPIQVQVLDLPEGVSAGTLEIPGGQSSGQLELAAAETLGQSELLATLRVVAKSGSLQAERPLVLTINKVNLPSFAPVSELVLLPGQSVELDLAVHRNGYQGPLKLAVDGLPDKLTAEVADLAPDQNSAKLKLAAAADAPDARARVRVAGRLYGRTIAAEVPLQIDRQPYRVRSFMVVTLRPGETRSVQIPLERRSYKGPIRLQVEGLPEGVTVPEVQVPAEQSVATLEFAAAAGARERVRSARVRSAGGHLASVDPIVVRVSHGGRGFLPQEVAADPDFLALFRRGSFGGRLTAESKQALLEAYGGTPESEQAVLRGLRWLAEHQQLDGRWSLKQYWQDVPGCDCPTAFEEEVLDNDVAGTAFGVLPFLGAGIVPNRSPDTPPEFVQYRMIVRNALAFLTRKQVTSSDPLKDGSLDANMYAHALATIALCEAYGLTGDEDLKLSAQRAIKYLIEAQHPKGGWWRYAPQPPDGDMSAVGWVFLAIRSGQLAGIAIRRSPLVKAERFVDSCAAGPEGVKFSRYCYQPGKVKPTPALSAAGLLTRQYLGWKKDNPDLAAGCRYLMENLPPESGGSLGPIYYYYYATQVLHHMEGPEFDLWNHRMREHLIRTQQKTGHRAGSWNPEGTDWGKTGGRLYATSMALMTLQVYYRHLPMYRPVLRTPQTDR